VVLFLSDNVEEDLSLNSFLHSVLHNPYTLFFIITNSRGFFYKQTRFSLEKRVTYKDTNIEGI
jgi:hypothetical protein